MTPQLLREGERRARSPHCVLPPVVSEVLAKKLAYSNVDAFVHPANSPPRAGCRDRWFKCRWKMHRSCLEVLWVGSQVSAGRCGPCWGLCADSGGAARLGQWSARVASLWEVVASLEDVVRREGCVPGGTFPDPDLQWPEMSLSGVRCSLLQLCPLERPRGRELNPVLLTEVGMVLTSAVVGLLCGWGLERCPSQQRGLLPAGRKVGASWNFALAACRAPWALGRGCAVAWTSTPAPGGDPWLFPARKCA